ncbi:unnamed protein product [Blepharisma stoltei]|uniref:Uncharacterized protein n=1 Tax=Blepharisma stoltei TaxID=1481888 RepID=A0AAU9JXZ9_9CILI|nr:unnamed protein product [Blepharisma stoltei]
MPFYGRSQKEILLRNRDAIINFPTNFCLRMSRKWMSFLFKLLDPNPNTRISSGEALKEVSDMLYTYQSSI